MKLSRVTVTGADDSIQPLQLIELTQKYPFVEWGILVSDRSMGKARFPSMAWLEGLAEVQKTFNLHLSAHVCGRWVRSLMTGNLGFFQECYDLLWLFDRYQLNFHREQLPENSAKPFTSALKRIESLGQFIFQQDGVNNDLLNVGHSAGVNSAALFDLSSGKGILPDEWPSPFAHIDCGYAGGLSGDNLSEQLKKLETVVGDTTIWIDAETRLRSADDSLLDLKEVDKYLAAAKPWAE